MLTEICRELKNWFVVSDDDKHIGSFTISDGVIAPLDDLKDGQFFRIVGSTFNDGVHTVEDVLIDEEFDGAVWYMSVPASFIGLVDRIKAYQEEYGTVTPFQSESFGGYSYSKSASSWKDAFRSELNCWRKM